MDHSKVGRWEVPDSYQVSHDITNAKTNLKKKAYLSCDNYILSLVLVLNKKSRKCKFFVLFLMQETFKSSSHRANKFIQYLIHTQNQTAQCLRASAAAASRFFPPTLMHFNATSYSTSGPSCSILFIRLRFDRKGHREAVWRLNSLKGQS